MISETASISILLMGIAKNVRRSIPSVLRNATVYGRRFRSHKTLVVENGSSDGTKEWAHQNSNHMLIEADHMRVGRDARNPRGPDAPLLAKFRKLYMEFIDQENNGLYPVAAIFDCDYINVHPISPSAITSAVQFLFADRSRAGVMANQKGFYYDIWALRHHRWCPQDCWVEYKAWCAKGLSHKATWACIGSRQVHIRSNAMPIEVDSAFGGFAIYKTELLKGKRYQDFSKEGVVACEHVSLHEEIRNSGGRLFVFPALMNSTSYEHIKRPRDSYYWYIRLREKLR